MIDDSSLGHIKHVLFMHILGTVVQLTLVKPTALVFNQASSFRNVKIMSHYIIKIQNWVAMNHLKLPPLNHQSERKLCFIQHRESQCIFNKTEHLYKYNFIIIFIVIIIKTRVRFRLIKAKGCCWLEPERVQPCLLHALLCSPANVF